VEGIGEIAMGFVKITTIKAGKWRNTIS